MEIRLDQLGDEPFVWQESLDVTPEELGHPDLLAISPVDVRGRIRRVPPGFLLEVGLDYVETLSCTRCLAPTDTAVASEISLLVISGEDAESEEERELSDEDIGLLFLGADEELSTRPILLEQLQLDVPMRPLCREDCAGLCPTCGADRNLAPCDCEPPPDPRWAALARLKTTP